MNGELVATENGFCKAQLWDSMDQKLYEVFINIILFKLT